VAHEDDDEDLFELLLGGSRPLRATEEPEPGDALPLEPGPVPAPASRGRPVLVGVGVGLAVGLSALAIAFSIIAIPMYALASFEPGKGLQRSTIRTGLLVVALPIGTLVGVVTGIIVGIWKARGGHLPTDRTPIHG
jgi:hypothetical protein